MLFKMVRLENFKRFRKLEHELGPGINVVVGRLNEIGKSTLLDGIVAALFENPKSAKKELERYTAWGSDHRCKTAIEFDAQGRRYLLDKDFDMRTMRLVEVDTAGEWNTPKDVAEKLRELLGTDSPTLFLSTCCIRQDEVSEISSGMKEIGESLEGIVTGGTEETVASRIVNKLSKEMSTLAKGLERPTKSPGPIARLVQQVNDLQGEVRRVEGEVADVERKKVELVEVLWELHRLEAKLGEAEALLERNKRRQGIEEAIGKLEKGYDTIDGLIQDIGSLQKRIQEVVLAIEGIEGFSDTQKVLECESQLRDLAASRRSVSEDLPKRRRELETAAEHLKRNRLVEGVASRASLIIGAAVSVTGFLGMIFNTASAVVGVVGLVFLVGALWARSSVTRQKTQVSDLRDRVGRMDEALSEVEKQEREILSQVSCGSAEGFQHKMKRHAELVRQKEALQNQLVGKLGAQTLEQYEQHRRETARMLAEERERLTDDLRSTKLSPEEYVRLEKEVGGLQTEKGQLQTRKIECQVGIRNARFDADDLTQREEKLDALVNALNREERTLRVYQLARDFVSKARSETLLSATELLQSEIEKNFEVFTNGKYKKVAVSEDALEFQIYSDEKGGWVRPDELSGGAIDEFYLACRLALVRLVYGEIRPPLVLDDPFVNFDEPRLARTLEFLRKLSKEHQVIILTLRDAYHNIADRVLELA